MSYRTHLLVVANQTVDSDELFEYLRDRAEQGPISVTLIVPQDHQEGYGHRLTGALERLHGVGIEAEGMLGDVDPACAVIEAWDPRRYDEVVVSTLPTGTSRWLRIDLPHRIARAVDAPVHHVVARRAADRAAV